MRGRGTWGRGRWEGGDEGVPVMLKVDWAILKVLALSRIGPRESRAGDSPEGVWLKGKGAWPRGKRAWPKG